MDDESRRLIDAQFDRAVQIVQGLPKTGPIQTGYEEKLTMYSLYKQATVGNVQPPRPSVWDMLGRAKWEAWAKHKDLDPYEAKLMYVDALLKVLRKYSDKTVAMDLVRELESYNADPSSMVMSGSLTRSRASSSSGSSESEAAAAAAISASRRMQSQPPGETHSRTMPPPETEHEESTSDEEDSDADEIDAPPPPSIYAQSQLNRPQSSLSSHRYRTPMASMLMTPPTAIPVPQTQPMPAYETPSAFEGGTGSPSIPSSAYPTTTVSYPGNLSQSSRTDITSPPNIFPAHPGYRGPYTHGRPYPLSGPGAIPRPVSRPVLERALENIQVHLAALTERIETLEGVMHRSTGSLASQPGGARSPGWTGRGSPLGGRPGDNGVWDFDDMGMWSLILAPLSRVFTTFQQLLNFLAKNDNRSPTLVVIRRLFLDISFVLSVLLLSKYVWRRSGMRRKAVYAALGGVWRTLIGQQRRPRVMVDRAV
ncbi:ACBP-domain-containing protein [Panus rudis PR-1116 ss-1]|nr:ACBP-domain-containing protein [Panus rudis PR-1116 ss-1]